MSTDTRDRLNELVAERGGNVEEALVYLLNEDWKAKCVADWDRYRDDNPQGFRDYLNQAGELGSLPDGFIGKTSDTAEDAA